MKKIKLTNSDIVTIKLVLKFLIDNSRKGKFDSVNDKNFYENMKIVYEKLK